MTMNLGFLVTLLEWLAMIKKIKSYTIGEFDMWPFKKKEVEEPKVDRTQICIENLKAFRKLGEKFNYLGVTIIVTGHHELELGVGYRLNLRPVLKGDYKNDKGEIKSISFAYRELPALQAENL